MGPTCSTTWFWTFPETNGTVQVELRVTNREFTPDLQNSSSPSYKEFVQNFTKQVKGHETPQAHLGLGFTWWRHPKVLCGVLWDGFGGGGPPK